VAAVDPEQYASEVETERAPDECAIAKRIGPVWSSTRTRERLGLVTRQALSSRRARGTILGVKTRDGESFIRYSSSGVGESTLRCTRTSCLC